MIEFAYKVNGNIFIDISRPTRKYYRRVQNNMSKDDRTYEEGSAGTDKKRKNDPLTEYSEEEAMTPAKIKSHEPTAVKREESDQKIVSKGQEGTNTEEAKQEYKKKGMTKVE